MTTTPDELIEVRVAQLNVAELAEVVQQFLDHAGITVHIEDRACYHLMGPGRRLELRGSLLTAMSRMDAFVLVVAVIAVIATVGYYFAR